MSEKIIGAWKLDSEDIKSQQIYGNVTIEFKNSEELIYTTQLKDKEQKMFYDLRNEG